MRACRGPFERTLLTEPLSLGGLVRVMVCGGNSMPLRQVTGRTGKEVKSRRQDGKTARKRIGLLLIADDPSLITHDSSVRRPAERSPA